MAGWFGLAVVFLPPFSVSVLRDVQEISTDDGGRLLVKVHSYQYYVRTSASFNSLIC